MSHQKSHRTIELIIEVFFSVSSVSELGSECIISPKLCVWAGGVFSCVVIQYIFYLNKKEEVKKN